MAKCFNFSLVIYYNLYKLLVTVKVVVLPTCNLVNVVEIFLLDVIDVDYYFISSRGTKYCDDLVCMSVCLLLWVAIPTFSPVGNFHVSF